MASLVGKLLGLLLCLQCGRELHGVRVKFTNVTCEVKDISIGIVDYCEINTLSPTKNLIRVRYSLAKSMMNNIWFWTQLMTRSSESPNGVSDWQPFLYSLNIDLCRVLKTRHNYVAKMILELIDGHSNLNHSCPYLEKTLAIDGITDTEASTRLRGIPMAKGFYSLYTKWIKEKKTLAQTNFYFEVLSI